MPVLSASTATCNSARSFLEIGMPVGGALAAVAKTGAARSKARKRRMRKVYRALLVNSRSGKAKLFKRTLTLAAREFPQSPHSFKIVRESVIAVFK